LLLSPHRATLNTLFLHMLKYLSYVNIFFGLVFLGLAKVNNNDLFLLFLPSILFNWLTLNYLLKGFALKKWHKVTGAISFAYALLSAGYSAYSLLSLSFSTYSYLLFADFVYGASIIVQLLLALGLDEQLKASSVSVEEGSTK